MITSEQMAAVVQARLDELTETQPFKFKIHTNMGDFEAASGGSQREKPVPLINGMLLSLPSAITPLQSVKSYTAAQLLTVCAPQQPNAPEQGIKAVMEVLETFVSSMAGFTGYIEDEIGTKYSYVFAPQLPQVGTLNNDIGFYYVPITLSLTWQFIVGGIISNGVTIKINGTNAILLDGGFTRTRIADTGNRSNSAEMKTHIGQQGLTLKVVVPFTLDGVGAELVRDMLIGGLEVFYSVEYDDGITKTESDANPAWTMVATEITENLAAGSVVSVTATFVIADENIYEV